MVFPCLSCLQSLLHTNICACTHTHMQKHTYALVWTNTLTDLYLTFCYPQLPQLGKWSKSNNLWNALPYDGECVNIRKVMHPNNARKTREKHLKNIHWWPLLTYFGICYAIVQTLQVKIIMYGYSMQQYSNRRKIILRGIRF